MRTVKQPQSKFGQVNIADIQFNPRSRDDIPAVLKGLQYIYINHDLREKVFAVPATSQSGDVRQDTGRPGMELWKVFVLGALKLALGCDYDRLQELANQHNTLRQMLGHSDWEENQQYGLQTLIDNISKLKIETLLEVNQLVVEAGHELVKKSLPSAS